MSSNNTSLTPSQRLVEYLSTLGTLRKPKLINAPKGTKPKGLQIFNPKPYDLQLLQSLATAVNPEFMVLTKPTPSQYEGRMVPPSIFVGIESKMDEDESASFFEEL